MVGGIAATSSLMFCFKSFVVLGFFSYTLLLRYPQRISQAQTVWFQQDRAMAQTAGIAMGVLNEMFPARVISRRGNIGWSARSPDLNACDFFLWGYLKSKVYEKKPRTTEDLKQNIREEVAAIPPTMLQRVLQNIQKRLRECVDN
jgi:hypothetical protein